MSFFILRHYCKNFDFCSLLVLSASLSSTSQITIVNCINVWTIFPFAKHRDKDKKLNDESKSPTPLPNVDLFE